MNVFFCTPEPTGQLKPSEWISCGLVSVSDTIQTIMKAQWLKICTAFNCSFWFCFLFFLFFWGGYYGAVTFHVIAWLCVVRRPQHDPNLRPKRVLKCLKSSDQGLIFRHVMTGLFVRVLQRRQTLWQTHCHFLLSLPFISFCPNWPGTAEMTTSRSSDATEP